MKKVITQEKDTGVQVTSSLNKLRPAPRYSTKCKETTIQIQNW